MYTLERLRKGEKMTSARNGETYRWGSADAWAIKDDQGQVAQVYFIKASAESVLAELNDKETEDQE